MGTWFNGCTTREARRARMAELAREYHPDLHPEDFERYNRIMAEILAEYRGQPQTITGAAPKPRPRSEPKPDPDPEPVANRPTEAELKAVTHYYTKETAAMIRRYLKRRFPGVRFYVKMDAGGGAVDVDWIDGPTEAAVRGALAGFNGRGFDGMTDSNYYVYSWLLPDGSAVIAGADWVPSGNAFWHPKPHPEARLVSFSCFVFTHRHYSRELLESIAQKAGANVEVVEEWKLGKNNAYYHYRATSDNRETIYQLYKIADATDAYTPPRPRRATKATTSTQAAGDVTITHDRDWTWVAFPGKAAWDALGEKKQVAFKALGFRWSRRRRAWYATKHVEEADIKAAIS